LKLIVKIIILLFFQILSGQEVIVPRNNTSIIINNDTLSNPFSRGFNRPLVQFIYWDNDNLLDLFISDSDFNIKYYEQDIANPELFVLRTRTFNDLIIGLWYRFVDYDSDGDQDLIHASIYPSDGGAFPLFVYENINGKLNFRTDKLLDFQGKPLTINSLVFPTFSDLDNDGLEDLFFGTIAGTVTQYKNLGLRDNLPLFRFETNTFENIMIVWTPARGNRHGANAIEFFDVDSDGDQDLFWGDIFQPSLFFLENIGTAENPDIRDTLMTFQYPLIDPIQTTGFNVARFADLDQDGDSELFVTVQSGVFGTELTNNFLYFENVGNAKSSKFQYKTNRFLRGLDLGSYSAPAFADIDADGDEDLFIGNEFNERLAGLRGTVFFFRNSGGSDSTILVLEDSTFFPELTGNNLTPAFADLDQDGDLDAIIGDWNGKLYKYTNYGSPSSPIFEYKGEFLGVDVGGLSHPALDDLDQDGDIDLLVGSREGNIFYWENVGSFNSPEFNLVSDDLFKGEQIGRKTAPTIFDINRDGRKEIVIGTEGGKLFLAFKNEGIWDFKEFDNMPYAGSNIVPSLVDLKKNGTIEMILGSLNGGLEIIKVQMPLTVANLNKENKKIENLMVSPNPFNSYLNLSFNLSTNSFVNISLFDLLGRNVDTILDETIDKGYYNFKVQPKDITSGIYIIKARIFSSIGSRILEKKIIYIK
tara:strand:- start:6580 stop:8679 length:2100 start_codon:yes stop_codon:yes gene_type:complete